MLQFLLWKNTDRKSLKDAMRDAAQRYQQKFGVTPNTFFINANAARHDYRVGSISIVRRHTVMENYIGVTYYEEPTQ